LVKMCLTLADPGHAPGAPPPPNGRGLMNLYAQNAIFFSFYFSLAMNFKHNLNRNMVKTRKNDFMTFYSTFNTLDDFDPPSPPLSGYASHDGQRSNQMFFFC